MNIRKTESPRPLAGNERRSSAEPQRRRAVTLKEASRVYGPSRSTLYSLFASGKLRRIKIGKLVLIPVDDLEALIAGGAEERP